MSEHTPGPWVDKMVHRPIMQDATDAECITVESFEGESPQGIICRIMIGDYRGGSRADKIARARANARLIASAPDLLAALRLWNDAFESGNLEAYDAANNAARAALAQSDKGNTLA